MAAATNPGNIGHAWVKALWIDKQAAPGMENPGEYDPADYDFIPARVSDNPIYAADENYLKTLRALPSHLQRAFLDGDWDVFAGQYFDKFDHTRHVARAEEIDWKPWWPRWISIDWGFEHSAATYWHAAIPAPIAGAPSGRHSERSVPSSVLREAPGRAVEESLFDLAATSASIFAPNPAAKIADQNRAREEASPKFPRRPRSWLGFAGASPRHATRIARIQRNIARRRKFPLRSLLPRIRNASHAAARTRPRNLRRSVQSNRHPERSPAPFSSRGVSAARDAVEGPLFDRCRQATLPSAPEKIDAIYLSPDAFARRTDEASIAEQMGDIFVAAGLPRPIPADDDRIGGWMLMYQMLDAGEWLLTENCIELIRTLPNLIRDPARIEDIEKMDGDDAADAARYGLKSRYGAHRVAGERRMPLADRIAARVVSADPTIRAMQARKAQVEESRAAKPVKFPHRHRRR